MEAGNKIVILFTVYYFRKYSIHIEVSNTTQDTTIILWEKILLLPLPIQSRGELFYFRTDAGRFLRFPFFPEQYRDHGINPTEASVLIPHVASGFTMMN